MSSARRTRCSGDAATAISSGNGWASVVVRSTSAGAGTRAVTIPSRCQPLPEIVNGLPIFDHVASIRATVSHILLTKCACDPVQPAHRVLDRLAVSPAATWGAHSAFAETGSPPRNRLLHPLRTT